jgi:two-component system, NarL family, response regulator EvgA
MQPPDRKSAPTPKGTCRVWIIEDHLSIRQLLESFVGLIPGFTVAGSSPAAEPAVEAARADGVDVILLDLMIRGDGGVAALHRLAELPRPPRVLIYSATATIHSLQLSLAHGAAGYVEKSDSLDELKVALNRLREGGMHFSQGPSRLLTSLLRPPARSRKRSEDVELKVLEKLARGNTIKATAHDLGLSVQKVYRLRQTLMERANAHTPQDLTRYAIEVGLVGAHRDDLG